MKSIKSKLIGLATIGGLIALAGFIQAQVATMPVQSISGNADQPGSQPDSVVQIAADSQGLALVPPDQLPRAGTFWVFGNGLCLAPYPCPPNDPDAIYYAIGPSGVFLVDATDGVVLQPTRRQAMLGVNTATFIQAQLDSVLNLITQQQTVQMNAMTGVSGAMSPMDAPFPGNNDDNAGTNTYFGSNYTAPNYGTNLWIANFALSSGNAVGIISNTLADVPYEIQYVQNLTSTQWQSPGWFVYGSELTNWTAMTVTDALSYTNNLFLRIRSWASSDGSGLPDWWELQYFGHTGIDPNALDSAGDGWTIWQKFQMGLNPNVFYTPPEPQGLTVSYNANNGTATVSWQPSPGLVTGYILITPDGQQWNLPANTTSFTTNLSAMAQSELEWDDYDPTFYGDFQLQAEYAGGNSTQNSMPMEPYYPAISLVAGPQGSAYLAATALPAGTTTVRFRRVDLGAENYYNDASYNTNLDIPLTAFTNGLYPLPASLVTSPVDGHGESWYAWWAQPLQNGTDNCEAVEIWETSGSDLVQGSLVPPFFDGREQLKQNLAFLLRAASTTSPFLLLELGTNFGYNNYVNLHTNPPTYAYAGFFQLDNAYNPSYGGFDILAPFENNYLYRNLVYSASDVNSGGSITTGLYYDYDYWTSSYGLILQDVPTYYFQRPTFNGQTISPILATNNTRWLCLSPLSLAWGADDAYISPLGVSVQYTGGTGIWTFSGNTNYWGLPFLSAEAYYYNTGGNYVSNVISLGGSFNSVSPGPVYVEITPPRFQTVGYDFWNLSPVPGMTNFSTSQTSDLIIAPVGNSINVYGYAKLAVTNTYNGAFAYLGQYFTNAYAIGTNGNITTNTTGVLSPYGQFFATQPGPAALMTMPDPDTGAQGTCTVYAISLALDKSRDGNMDLSWNGPDATSQASPDIVWVNNGLTIPGTGGNLDYDVQPETNGPVNYSSARITCQRDLENFFRLWICGLPKLPMYQGYTVTMSFQNTVNDPAVNLYWSCETNGGIGYLTDTNIAAMQTTAISVNGGPPTGYGVSLGTVSNNCSYTFPDGTFAFGGTQYLLFEGAGIGSGQLTLTISQNGNQLAQTGVWLDLHDIKDFYERTVITNIYNGAISNSTSIIQSVQHASSSALSDDTNLIVMVHGINVDEWHWFDESDTVFKRLYWAGYHGKFATVKWPCKLFTLWTFLMQDYTVFNDSEINAYKAGTAMKTYVDQLHAQFPGCRLHLFVHSQGNSVVSEAIEQGAAFDTYILTQGALPASCYDANAPLNTFLANYDATWGPTPEWQPMGYRGVYTNLTGRIVNFYNLNDPVLADWVTDEAFAKPNTPNTDYSYNGTTGTCNPPFGSSYVVTDPQESRAYVSRSRTLPIGQSGPESQHGVIQSGVDLHANFGFYNAFPADHSAQWTWPIQTCWGYYDEILGACLIPTIQR